VIISDLQHIESATGTEVQGGNGNDTFILFFNPGTSRPARAPGAPVFPSPYNFSSANAGAQAFGTNTRTFTTTDTLVIQGQFSGSSSSSFAEAT
jgi:hypothetical protein